MCGCHLEPESRQMGNSRELAFVVSEISSAKQCVGDQQGHCYFNLAAENGLMRNPGMVVASVLVVVLSCFGAGTSWAQMDVGTPAAAMTDPNAPKIAIQVTADGDFTWKVDTHNQGQITAAMGAKRVMLASPGPHQITAR